jgi:GntR family transcriptional repressor for pyruvate dehydrogenase complex
MITSLLPLKVAESVAGHLEHLILDGTLRPGERLMAERELALRLEVSRPTLRDALRLLEERGLLVTEKGRTHVAPFLSSLTNPLAALLKSDPQVTDDYFEYREMVEAKAAALAASRATEPDKQAIGACFARMKSAHLEKDPTAEATADADLHLLIYEAGHNLVILHVMRAFSAVFREDIFQNRGRFYEEPGLRDTLLGQHRAIVDAILAGDSVNAEILAREHVRHTFTTLCRIKAAERRHETAIRRLNRKNLVAGRKPARSL